jgi:hypothetical protein
MLRCQLFQLLCSLCSGNYLNYPQLNGFFAEEFYAAQLVSKKVKKRVRLFYLLFVDETCVKILIP